MASKVTHVGFSGTRDGMNDFQKNHVTAWLSEFYLRAGLSDLLWFHHGDCVGADAEAQRIAMNCGYNIHLHPPLDQKHSAHLRGYGLHPSDFLLRRIFDGL